MAKIMVIAGGEWQCPIIKAAKEMGHFVICTNLYRDSPGFAFSDVCEVADVRDKERNLAIAKRYQPDAVLTDQSDIAVPTVAYVAEQMGLKGIGTKQALLYTNKYLMREFCRKHGFPCPEYRVCHTSEEAETFLQDCLTSKKKAIVKPLDSQSSRGVHVISTKEQLPECFEDAMEHSISEKAVLIEQYIEGKEFTVDGLKNEDGYEVTAISKKEHFKHNPNIAKELLFSNSDKDYDYDRLKKINKRYVMESGLPFGLTHAEYKYMDGTFYLIEIAARGGGTKISSDIVPIMSGINSNQIYMNMLTGIYNHANISCNKNRYAVLGFFDFRPGTVAGIDGLERAYNINGVKDIHLNFSVGNTISAARDDRSRAGHYIIAADSYEALRCKEEAMNRLLQIKYL